MADKRTPISPMPNLLTVAILTTVFTILTVIVLIIVFNAAA